MYCGGLDQGGLVQWLGSHSGGCSFVCHMGNWRAMVENHHGRPNQ